MNKKIKILIGYLISATLIFATYTPINYKQSVVVAVDNPYLSKLNGKNIAFLGDSLTSQADHKKYIDFVRDNTGANCFNYGVNESTITQKGNDNISFVTRYKDIIKEHQDPNFFDLIIIFGGVNDFAESISLGNLSSDNTTFYGGLNEIVYQLQYHYPKAKIVLMTPLISTWDGCIFDYTINGQGVILEKYREAIREVARTQGCIVFETHMLSGLNPNNGMIFNNYYQPNSTDGIHPNEQGQKRIALPLINVLENLY